MSSDLNYTVSPTTYGLAVCVEGKQPSAATWGDGPAIQLALPYFITQLFVSNLAYRVLHYITRPLHMPNIVSQILCGLVLGPSGFGENRFFEEHVFPYRFTPVLETFANIATIFYMFLVGLEVDLNVILHAEVKAFSVAAAGILVPAAVGAGMYYDLDNQVHEFTTDLTSDKKPAGYMFWAIVLMNTNFPDLARILADLKLLRSDIGRTAMGASLITDLLTWILLGVAFAMFDKNGKYSPGILAYALASTLAFVIVCVFLLRPALHWIIERTTKRDYVSDSHVWFALAGAMLCGLVTDILGVHSVIGAVLFGAIMPKSKVFRQALAEKLEDFVSGLLMPLFYVVSGLRSDLPFLAESLKPGKIAMVIAGSFLAKVLSTFMVSKLHHIPKRDGLALGLLMNTKGVLSLLVLNSARDVRALDSRTFTAMVIAVLVMSTLVQPIIALTYTPRKQPVQYKQRTVRKVRQNGEFRVLACVHDLQNAYGMANVLQVSNATEQPPLIVTVAHLVELTGRTTASVLVMNEDSRSRGSSFADRAEKGSQQIANAFETIREENQRAAVHTVTLVSPYSTMHEDICSLAEDKMVCFIIMPYHKQLTTDLRMVEGNEAHANINFNLFDTAPCSVGILVDRGISRLWSEEGTADILNKQIAMLFIGGPDDREALAYAWRMTADQTVSLTVVRFLPSHQAVASPLNQSEDKTYEREKRKDDEWIYEFRFKTSDNPSVSYMERIVNDGHETVSMIRELEERISYELYIVGRGNGVESPMTAGLTDWDSNLELGTIGDTLASSSFMVNASVLVVQRYTPEHKRARESKKGDLDDFKPLADGEYSDDD